MGYLSWMAMAFFCALPLFICLSFGVSMPAAQVEGWLLNTLADMVLTFIFIETGLVLFAFLISLASVKWFSGTGLTGLLKCTPCRRRRTAVVPASIAPPMKVIVKSRHVRTPMPASIAPPMKVMVQSRH